MLGVLGFGASGRVLFVGEARSIIGYLFSTTALSTAAANHGATSLYIRLGQDQQARLAEVADLVECYRPPMNEIYTADEDLG